MKPSKHRILCVDDDRDTCDVLETLLSSSGWETICVGDVTAALWLMKSEQFRLYIIDSQLPGTSGLTMCEEIRKHDRETPIIIFSGHAFPQDRDAGLQAGANAYVVKPDTSQLVPTIKRLLQPVEAATMNR